jgi:hypothetical protein
VVVLAVVALVSSELTTQYRVVRPALTEVHDLATHAWACHSHACV